MTESVFDNPDRRITYFFLQIAKSLRTRTAMVHLYDQLTAVCAAKSFFKCAYRPHRILSIEAASHVKHSQEHKPAEIDPEVLASLSTLSQWLHTIWNTN